MTEVQNSQVIVVTSGKGGVGKTTTSAAFAAGLALRGHKTVVVDFDVGLRNLDLVMGCERRVIFDITHVISGEAKLGQALIKDKRVDNLYVLATSQTKDKDVLTQAGVNAVIEALRNEFEYIICDSPAGIEQGALMALYHADQAIVVTNPEISSVRDSDRILGLIASRSKRAEEERAPVKEHLLVTRYDESRVKSGAMLNVNVIQDILSVDLLGIIPESHWILRASNLGRPVSLEPNSDAGQAYKDAIARFLGDPAEVRAPEAPKAENRTIFQRLFSRKIAARAEVE
ncbi:MAG TPA: septum site-determining protein MinD [Acetobacteraceae bacterium]|nr:septum site-determining protein MinD [Acetobacteraceae bacterium]